MLEKDGEDQLGRPFEKWDVLHRVIEEEEYPAYTIGHILRRNCLIDGKVDESMYVTGRRQIRRKQLLDDLKCIRN
jgi:hypothetical protein